MLGAEESGTPAWGTGTGPEECIWPMGLLLLLMGTVCGCEKGW